MVALADVERRPRRRPTPDLAIVDLSFPQERARLARLAPDRIACHRPPSLAIITQGDEWVAQLLRDAWELLPITTVISKSAPLAFQLDAIRRGPRRGSHHDPAIQPLLPKTRRALVRRPRFGAFVQHAGHAKLWRPHCSAIDDANYKALADTPASS